MSLKPKTGVRGKKGESRRAKKNHHDGNALVASFADRMKKWRKAEGKTLKQVAAGIGVSIAIVSEWENAHRFPSVSNLVAIAEYTGIPAWKFFKT